MGRGQKEIVFIFLHTEVFIDGKETGYCKNTWNNNCAETKGFHFGKNMCRVLLKCPAKMFAAL